MDPLASGRYEFQQEIGRGGMGRVVKARDTVLDRLVAIKIVAAGSDPSFIARLTREARATARLSHPNIVTVYDVGQTSDSAFIVMEYVAGETLDKRMNQGVGPDWAAFVPVLAQCAAALDYAHREGIVHRDIKPSNIMIRNDGAAKILDFGIAKFAASREASLTQSGTFIGTPKYIAPEQVLGNDAGPRTDQYALGMIAYRLMAGRYPFDGEDITRLFDQVTRETPPPPSAFNPSLPRKIDEALLKSLDKDPAQRFDSCQKLIEAFEDTPAEKTGSRNAPVTMQETPVRGAENAIFSGLKRFFNISENREKAPSERPAIPAAPIPKPSPAPRVGTNSPSADVPAPPAAPQAEPGEFTRMFQIPSAPSPPLPAAPPAAPPAEPGEFTRMFQSPSAPPQQPPMPQPPQQLENNSGPGELTMIFQRADLARAQARELMDILDRRDFADAIALRGNWLPGIEGAPSELIGFSEAARYLGAAQNAVSPHVRIEHLKNAEKVLFSVGNQLLADDKPTSRLLPEALEVWKAYAHERLAAARQWAASEIPNPFRAGQPLRPDQGLSVFRGRDALVRSIEAILADADQSSSLALLGPRRCGKTSLLQMLPAMLPDCACIFFDLQDNPVSTVSEFFEALVRRAREQVGAQRRIEIPKLPGSGTFEGVTQWFDLLDRMTEVNRFLVSIDEFERLEDLFPGDRRDLLRLMGLFRATIQHRRKVRLLVSGVAPFEELGPLWNDHFINIRELRIGHLDEATSIDLLTRPIPDFPADAVPATVARRIFERTAGQPYLVQLYGTLLINRLNEKERTTASTEDVEAIEQDALCQGRYYFGNIYQDSPVAVRQALEALARGEMPSTTGATRRWLERRSLIDDRGTLLTPVLGAFIREELGI